MIKHAETPESRCPYCDQRFGAATAINPNNSQPPQGGDVTVCISCASALVFNDDLTVRAPAPGELEPDPRLDAAQAAVRALDRRDRMAPSDGIWVCQGCGKTAVDRYGIEGGHSPLWDESCMLNAVLCKRGSIVPGERVTQAESYGDEPLPDGVVGHPP